MVSLLISCDFLLPECRIGFWHSESLAPFVSMPEAAIDKDTGAVFPHHDIGVPGQSLMIEPVPEPSCKEIFPHNEFGPGVLGMDGRHIVVASLLLKRCHGYRNDLLGRFRCPVLE